jgi:anaerobic magnesium-protoporphyrin IX monomethyl ester cyclase
MEGNTLQTVLFVVPPYLEFKDFVDPPGNSSRVVKNDGRNYGNLTTDMPLGILSLSAYLKVYAQPVRTALIDYNVVLNETAVFTYGSYYSFFLDHLIGERDRLANAPDIIGISALFTPSYYAMLDLARACREVFPHALLIGGGGIPAAMYRQIFSDAPQGFDALCYGEGERPLLGLVKAADKQQLLASHPSWMTPDKAFSGGDFAHDFIADLDEIPFYDYSLCEGRNSVNPAFPTYGLNQRREAGFHVMTSRGCPFKCIFCASHRVHGRKMRYYSLQRVREDFTRLRDEYGADTVVFQDDHLMGDTKRAYEIIQMVADLGLKAIFQNSLTLYALDRRMLEAIARVGSQQLVLSVESGSARVLKEVMRKPLKLSMIKRVVDDCRDLGIYTYANVLIGLPGETRADIDETRQFLRTIDANWYGVFCASPLPGSEMFEICEENAYLTYDHIGADFKRAVVETPDFTAAYIQDTTYLLNLELNFVHNSDMRLGNYEVALVGIKKAIRAKPDHAIAHYFAGQCHEQLGDRETAEGHRNLAIRIVEADSVWRDYFQRLGLSLP